MQQPQQSRESGTQWESPRSVAQRTRAHRVFATTHLGIQSARGNARAYRKPLQGGFRIQERDLDVVLKKSFL